MRIRYKKHKTQRRVTGTQNKNYYFYSLREMGEEEQKKEEVL